MAIIDQLTDGTDTVDLAATANGFNNKYTFRQAIVDLDPITGDYRPVTEEFELNWYAATDLIRATMHATLMRLQYKAQRWASGDYRLGPVWRKCQTVSEFAARYAIVTDVKIPWLDPEAYGPDANFKPSKISITREGAWRAVIPTSTIWYSINPAVPVYDYDNGTVHNRLTVSPGTAAFFLYGDANGLLRFRLDYGNGAFTYNEDNQMTIAKKTGESSTALNAFNPHFNPSSAVSPSGFASLVADATVPGGQRLHLDNTGTSAEQVASVEWQVASLEAYSGNYIIVAPIKMTGASDYCYVQFKYGFGVTVNNWVESPPVLVPAGHESVYQKIFVANVNIPPVAYNDYQFYVALQFTIPAGVEFDVRNWWMIPADEGVFEVRNIGDEVSSLPIRYVVVDGSRRRSYPLYNGDDTYFREPEVSGNYLTADHQRYTRFYFFKSYWDADEGIDAIEPALSSTQITLDAIPRVKALMVSHS